MNREEKKIADRTARVFEIFSDFYWEYWDSFIQSCCSSFIRRRVCETQFVMMNRSSLSRSYYQSLIFCFHWTNHCFPLLLFYYCQSCRLVGRDAVGWSSSRATRYTFSIFFVPYSAPTMDFYFFIFPFSCRQWSSSAVDSGCRLFTERSTRIVCRAPSEKWRKKKRKNL